MSLMSEEEDEVRLVSPRPFKLLVLSMRDPVLKVSAGAQLEKRASHLASDATSKVKLVSWPARGKEETFQDLGRLNARLQPVLAWART